MSVNYHLAEVTNTSDGKNIRALQELTLQDHSDLRRDALEVEAHEASCAMTNVPRGNLAACVAFLEHCVRRRPVPSTRSVHAEAIRHVLNVLSGMRMFLDHALWRARKEWAKPQRDEFKKACSKIYDESVAYRLCYELRNHALHKGAPAIQAQIRSGVEPDGEDLSLQHMDGSSWAGVHVFADRGILLDDVGNATRRSDIEKMPERIELIKNLQEMQACLESVGHRFFEMGALAVAAAARRVCRTADEASRQGCTGALFLFESGQPVVRGGRTALRMGYVELPVSSARRIVAVVD